MKRIITVECQSMSKLGRHFLTLFSLFFLLTKVAFAADPAVLKQIDSVILPGDEIELKLSFASAVATPSAYQIEKPARLVFDLLGTKSELTAKYQSLGTGNAKSMAVVEAADRTRLIVNLGELAGYRVRTEGDKVFINIGKSISVAQGGIPSPSAASANASTKSVQNVDFRRGDQGDGVLLIDMSSSSVAVDVKQQGTKVVAKFIGAKLPESLRRRLDVKDFATPVQIIDAFAEGGSTVISLQQQGDFEYLAYQADNKFTISVKPVTKEDAKRKKDFVYAGEKLSLNFQDIEVRSVLQLIADFTSMNLVASDSVGGRITLRLQNVPWDQALDLILKTKGLDKRSIGNVMLVAPADEIAQRERLEMQSNTDTEKLSPLRSEYIQVNYAKAADIVALIGGPGKLLSERGRALVDSRTNTIIVVDTAKRIDDVRDMVNRLDVPVKQVMIEARIVLATANFLKDAGVKWGFTRLQPAGSRNTLVAGGSRKTVVDNWEFLGELEKVRATPDPTDRATRVLTQPDDLMVDLGVDKSGASSFAIGIISAGGDLLDLELSALQSDGNAEIVSTPKVLTADKQKARIAAGQQIPFQQATSSGATAIAFQNAELSLEVTPSITPDGRINMDLLINNDSPGDLQANGTRAINTNRIATSVRVDDGQTVVLGGIFQTNKTKSVSKTPLLGDIPFIGRLFRLDSFSDTKQELLIFVTPRLATDALSSSK